MYERSAASASSNSVPAKHDAGLDQREEAARREIEALQHARDQADDLARRTSRPRARSSAAIDGEHRLADRPSVFSSTRPISGSLKRRSQQRVVELAERAQRPALGRPRATDRRPASRGCGLPARAIVSVATRARASSSSVHVRVCDPCRRRSSGSSGGSVDARRRRAAGRDCAASSLRALGDGLLELARRDTTSSTRPHSTARLPLHALGERAEHVGQVAAHLALVDEARQAAGAGQHAEQRHLGQAHRRVAVVDEQDLVARERQLVAAAGARAVDARRGT